MPWLVHVAGINGGIEVPRDMISPYLPCSDYKELLQDAAVEQLKTDEYVADPEQVTWYPENHTPQEEWDEYYGGDE